jgi:hypothetical protein
VIELYQILLIQHSVRLELEQVRDPQSHLLDVRHQYPAVLHKLRLKTRMDDLSKRNQLCLRSSKMMTLEYHQWNLRWILARWSKQCQMSLRNKYKSQKSEFLNLRLQLLRKPTNRLANSSLILSSTNSKLLLDVYERELRRKKLPTLCLKSVVNLTLNDFLTNVQKGIGVKKLAYKNDFIHDGIISIDRSTRWLIWSHKRR